jgi:hypothetical protein
MLLMNKKLLFIIPLILSLSCNTRVSNQTTVYNNDFEKADLTNITGGVISQYNGTAVLGQYNNGLFSLTLNNLPKHKLITISFDLYIHDTWDGNKMAPDGPDIWEMLVDGNTYINTTFSNDVCAVGNFCSPQSYPLDYPNNYNNPKTGAYRTDLPGVCSMKGIIGWTSQYKITKTFTHSNSTLLLQCLDKLVQTNTPDPKCDESWSVDNINIQAITL